MGKDIHFSFLLNKYEKIYQKYLDLRKLLQNYLYIIIFTSVVFLLLSNSLVKFKPSEQLFIILLFPAISLLMLWVQYLLFYTPSTIKFEGEDIHEQDSLFDEKYFELTMGKSQYEFKEIFKTEYKILKYIIIKLNRKIKQLQMLLTITWMFLILNGLFYIFYAFSRRIYY